MYTLSLHNGDDTKIRQDHNARRYIPDNADPTKTKDNIILQDYNIRQAYRLLFGEAQQEYNNRVIAKRNNDRIIKDYYTKIANDPHKRTAYELVVQLGGRGDGGAPDQAVNALIQYALDWNKANPNLYCFGAYIHIDEETPHLHLDYIPVADCTRGMHKQNSLTKALSAQGFVSRGTGKKDTAQIRWEQSERDRLRDICQGMGISLHAQGIGRKRYLSVGEYKQAQDELHAAQEQAKQASQAAAAAQAEADGLQRDITAYRATIDKAQRQLEDIGRQCMAKRNELEELDQQITQKQKDLQEVKNIYNANDGDHVRILEQVMDYLDDEDLDYGNELWDRAMVQLGMVDDLELEAEADEPEI